VRTLWAGRETRHAPALSFLAPRQQAELSAEDAQRLGVRPGDEVEVAANGTSVRAVARLRQAVPPGTVFLLEGTDEDSATALMNGSPRVVEVRKA
jgi:NADH-quinone oxidoreductase subunit G